MCIYTHTHTHTHTHIYIYIHTHTHTQFTPHTFFIYISLTILLHGILMNFSFDLSLSLIPQ